MIAGLRYILNQNDIPQTFTTRCARLTVSCDEYVLKLHIVTPNLNRPYRSRMHCKEQKCSVEAVV